MLSVASEVGLDCGTPCIVLIEFVKAFHQGRVLGPAVGCPGRSEPRDRRNFGLIPHPAEKSTA